MRPTTEAAILCGGRGERLKPLSDYFQKVMIPIGPKKVPLLAYILRLITYHGVTKAALLTGYRSEDIRRYFGNGSQYGIKLAYSEDQKSVKGNLNAVVNALRARAVSKCDELLIYYGDVLADLDITSLIATHRKAEADLTLVLAKGYALPVGTAEVSRRGFVTSFHEKPKLDINVTTGCMLAGPEAISLMKRLAGAKNTDLMSHFVPAMIQRGAKVAAYYTESDWFDVGTIASYETLNRELTLHPPAYFARP